MSHRQPAIRSLLARDFRLVLGVAVALLAWSGSIVAQNKAAAPRPEDDLAPLILAEFSPIQLATLAVGGSAQPSTGAYLPAGILRMGAHPGIQAWTIEDPLANPTTRAVIGAATLALSLLDPQPLLSELVMLRAGDMTDCWTLMDTDQVRRIPPFLLMLVRDERKIPESQSNDLELEAYFPMVIWAGKTSQKGFWDSARRDVTYRHLFEEPRKYRGEVVYLEGKLKRLDRYEAPLMIRQAGFPFLYEAWIFDEVYGANPFCVLFTELPANLKVGEKQDVKISFAGYFYKKYRYRAGDSVKANERRDAPLLIGRTLQRLSAPAPVEESSDWARDLVPLFLWLVVGAVSVVVGISLWFRHTDRKVRGRLAVVRNQDFVVPTPEAEKNPAEEVTNSRAITTENAEEF